MGYLGFSSLTVILLANEIAVPLSNTSLLCPQIELSTWRTELGSSREPLLDQQTNVVLLLQDTLAVACDRICVLEVPSLLYSGGLALLF